MQRRDILFHLRQAIPIGDGLLRKSAAVVPDRDYQPVTVDREAHIGMGGGPVAPGIGDGLLHQAESQIFLGLVDVQRIRLIVQVDGHGRDRF